eukprot:1571850-Rhodomonas_salina.2
MLSHEKEQRPRHADQNSANMGVERWTRLLHWGTHGVSSFWRATRKWPACPACTCVRAACARTVQTARIQAHGSFGSKDDTRRQASLSNPPS